MNKTLFVILDGAPDVGKKTPLSEANKPNIDWLASHSICGMWQAKLPKNYSLTNFSDIGTSQLLGCYEYPGRGYLEALGIGLKPEKNAIYLRANFATVKKLGSGYGIVDRRSGRDETGLDELAKEINKIKIEGATIKFYRGVGHRGILVVNGRDINWKITEADKGTSIDKIKALDRSAEKTADILNKYVDKVYEALSKHPVNKKRKLAANFISLRGISRCIEVDSFQKMFGLRAAAISGVGIVKGVARFLGIDVIDVKGATGHYHTNLQGKIEKTIEILNKYDFVILHINGADESAHDKNFSKKKEFIEMVDKIIFSEIVKLKNINVIFTADHITSSKTGMHMKGRVPFLIYRPNDDTYNKRSFSEHISNDFFTDNPMKKLLLEIRK